MHPYSETKPHALKKRNHFLSLVGGILALFAEAVIMATLMALVSRFGQSEWIRALRNARSEAG
jgi:hypothetical protein